MGATVKRLAIAMLLAGAGCAGENDPMALTAATTATAGAQLTVSVQPIALIVADDGSDTPLSATWNVVITESSGRSGGTVKFLNATVRDAQSGAAAIPPSLALTETDIAALAGTSRLAAGGSITVPLSLVFGLRSGGQRATVSVAVQVLDDNGETISAIGQGDLH